jgi:UDP-2-acetamido-3-amino-2,3-dideoxy-glucuronate N-acetyltransferase
MSTSSPTNDRGTTVTDHFVHPAGICETEDVGPRTRIWAFAHVLPGARIGADCNICDHVFIEGDVIVGDRVTIKSGVQLWDGIRLGDDVFVGPNATFSNDKFPRSRQWQERVPLTMVADGASIGANATVLPGVTIGRNAMIGAGSVVTRDVPANAIAYGNPARIHGYVDAGAEDVATTTFSTRSRTELPGGARLIDCTRANDMRGSLVALELADALPFAPRRFFSVFGVPSAEVRGEHAHRVCHQLLICLRGSLVVLVDDGGRRQEVTLADPARGLYIPPMVWGTQFGYTADAVLMVLASHAYDAADYVRDYEVFRKLKGRQEATPEPAAPPSSRDRE